MKCFSAILFCTTTILLIGRLSFADNTREPYWNDYGTKLSGFSTGQLTILEETLANMRALRRRPIIINKQAYKRLSHFKKLFSFEFDGEKLFHWVMSRIKKVSYGESWTVAVNQNKGHLILGDEFFSEMTMLERLYLLIHEARHSDGDGYTHVKCPKGFLYISAAQPSMRLEGTKACDADLNGAYAFQASFLFELYAYGLFDQKLTGLTYNSSITRILQ